MSAALRVERYAAQHRPAWDSLVRASRTGVFLFERDYMDYHSSRFEDRSLMVWIDDSLVAVLPASGHGDEVRSHGGLTFGGLVTRPRAGAALVLSLMGSVIGHLRAEGFSQLLYKPVPHIYHSAPAEEDLYALFRAGAALVRRDASSSISRDHRVPPTKGRRAAVGQARRHGVVVSRSDDFHTFMELEERHLLARHGVRPVHTGDEMALLAARFPEHIALHTAHLGDELLAGVIVYESARVAHAQYIAASDRGREVAAGDLLLHHLLTDVYVDKPWFDFGISTEGDGQHLNTGLVANKESFGARTTVYDWYSLALAP